MIAGQPTERVIMSSIVIRGGTVIDGTGAPRRDADVLVRDGRIAAIGKGLSGDREIDASGAVVAPGFIDIHTHYDARSSGIRRSRLLATTA